MNPWRILLLIAPALCLMAQPQQPHDCAKERAQLQSRFGTQLEFLKSQKPCAVTGDFNRDGKPDFALLARTAQNELDAAISIQNPFKPKQTPRPKKGTLVLAVVLEGPQPKLFVFSDPDFFTSPMWSNPDRLISLVTKPAPRIGLASEGGPTMQLYWTTSGWRLYMPDEEP
jgi:hypothetical protein